MRFITMSGSVYEMLDNKIRRLNENKGSSNRVGHGEWKPIREAHGVQEGKQALIIWDSEDLLPTTKEAKENIKLMYGIEVDFTSATLTSPIVRVIESQDVN